MATDSARAGREGAEDEMVCVGAISGAHGVRGLVRVKSFTETPEAIMGYGPFFDETGAPTFALAFSGGTKGQLLARVEGVADREAAEALKGVRLYVPRRKLPEPAEDEYYHSDLIGLAVVRADGRPLGTVRAVHDFGAGPILEIARERRGRGGSVLLPFTRAAVPEVDIDAGRLVVELPAGLLEEDAPEAEDGR